MGHRPSPPLVTVLIVAGLANPEFLLEIEAVAVTPEDDAG
jgi:enamine deaminase RidA (YjgF/YER057c/UK114 family)